MVGIYENTFSFHEIYTVCNISYIEVNAYRRVMIMASVFASLSPMVSLLMKISL